MGLASFNRMRNKKQQKKEEIHIDQKPGNKKPPKTQEKPNTEDK